MVSYGNAVNACCISISCPSMLSTVLLNIKEGAGLLRKAAPAPAVQLCWSAGRKACLSHASPPGSQRRLTGAPLFLKPCFCIFAIYRHYLQKFFCIFYPLTHILQNLQPLLPSNLTSFCNPPGFFEYLQKHFCK